MALTRQTMTDEQHKSVALEYLKAFDKAGVTSDGGSVLDLFAEDAQVYFPKWGLADGREAIGRLFADVGGMLKGIVHDAAVSIAGARPEFHVGWFGGGLSATCREHGRLCTGVVVGPEVEADGGTSFPRELTRAVVGILIFNAAIR